MTDITERLDQAAARAIYAADTENTSTEGQAARRAILAELDAMGWVCVPKSITPAMAIAAEDQREHVHGSLAAYHSATFRVMLAAAPKLKD